MSMPDKPIKINPVKMEDVSRHSSEQQKHKGQHASRIIPELRFTSLKHASQASMQDTIKKQSDELAGLKQQIQELTTQTGSAMKDQEEPGPEPE